MGNMLSCCVTGHRKLVPQGYNGGAWWAPSCYIVEEHHTRIKQQMMLKVIDLYTNHGTIEFISGGAIGADILFAEIIIELRNMYKYPITLGIAKPFPSHSSKWNYQTTVRYNNVLSEANWVYNVSPDPYSYQKMQIRNKWMVNRAGIVIAVWNNIQKGGTWNCINYAAKQRVHTLIITV